MIENNLSQEQKIIRHHHRITEFGKKGTLRNKACRVCVCDVKYDTSSMALLVSTFLLFPINPFSIYLLHNDFPHSHPTAVSFTHISFEMMQLIHVIAPLATLFSKLMAYKFLFNINVRRQLCSLATLLLIFTVPIFTPCSLIYYKTLFSLEFN